MLMNKPENIERWGPRYSFSCWLLHEVEARNKCVIRKKFVEQKTQLIFKVKNLVTRYFLTDPLAYVNLTYPSVVIFETISVNLII